MAQDTNTFYDLSASAMLLAGGISAANKTGLFNALAVGSQYSFGAERIVGNFPNYGGVFAFGEKNVNLLRNAATGRNFAYNVMTPGQTIIGGQLNVDDFFTRGAGGALEAGGLMRGGLQNLILPIAFTGLGTLSAYSEGGLGEAGKYLAQDFLAMHYAGKASMVDINITGDNLSKLSKFTRVNETSLRAELANAPNNIGAYTFRRTTFGSVLLQGLHGAAGALIGAQTGMSAGASLGSFASEYLKTNAGVDTGGLLGFIGGAFGAQAGAKIGAAAFASLPRAGMVGAGLYATTLIAKGTYSMLESGFKKQRNRGLGFASDTSQFMTQQAVTMRQRALQATHKSHLNARSAFGQEATITHMNRDMFSHYKR